MHRQILQSGMENWPLPDAHALAVSQSLSSRLLDQARQDHGWLAFDDFMQSALYMPGLGYYSAGQRKFGPGGDFVTAPELSPLFGACIANNCAQWFDDVPAVITEFGAGSGQLAAQILNHLDRKGCAPQAYQIIELSATLRARQQNTVATLAPGMSERVRWLDTLPAQLSGVVLANEVLDAMPVKLFELREQSIFERGLAINDAATGFCWQSRPADAGFAELVDETLIRAGWGGHTGKPDLGAWPDGYVSELGHAARAWMRTVAELMQDAVLLVLDYGFPASEFFHPQRDQGTLTCHYRHHSHHDPLLYPGLQDITAHVDYSALAQEAWAAGLNLLGYTSQASFLLHGGLLDLLAHVPVDQTADYVRQSQAVRKLATESEMGELFKVIAWANRALDPGAGFSGRDRSGALLPTQASC